METKFKLVKTKKSAILKEFIIEKYGSISKFTRKEKIPRGDVEIILHKADIFNEMNIGMKVCKALHIDVEELFCRGNIKTADASTLSPLSPLSSVLSDLPDGNSDGSSNITSQNMPPDEIIRKKYLKLGEEEQRKILDYINSILEN